MATESSDPVKRFRPVGYPVTLLVLYCARCRRLSTAAVDGACLQRDRQRIVLRDHGVCEWPVLRCPTCESTDLHLVEDLR
jgi:hypothetical protein